MRQLLVLLSSLMALAACGDDPTGTRQGTPGGSDSGDSADSDEPVAEGCHATPLPDDSDRLLLVSFAYDSDYQSSELWGAARLAQDGTLTTLDVELSLGHTTGRVGAFTPDGAFGFVTTDMGLLSTVAVGDDLEPTIVDAEVDAGLYAEALVVHPSGEWLLATDGNWPENGGGLYRLAIDCDSGALGAAERLFEAKNPFGVARRPGTIDQYAFYGREVPGTASGTNLHLVDLSTSPATILSSVAAFPDEDAIVSDLAFDHDGDSVLVADHSEWTGNPTRIAAVEVEEDTLRLTGTLEVDDPMDLVAAPWPGGGMLVLSGYGDAVWALDQSGDSWSVGAKVASSALPGAAVVVTGGPLQGRVLVAEVNGVRAIDLSDDGGATDLGIVAEWDALPWGLALRD
jgi:hypothetical protein